MSIKHSSKLHNHIDKNIIPLYYGQYLKINQFNIFGHIKNLN
jgi:hypothetical protein